MPDLPTLLALLATVHPMWFVAGALGVALLIQRARPRRARKRKRQAFLARAEWAARAEELAAQVLREAGYTILSDQSEHVWDIYVDGEAHPITLRADYLVRRGGRRYVAEVKTGRTAPDVTCAATRRQLLEYRVAYDVAGVILVDMESYSLHEVDFGLSPESSRHGFVVGAMLGIAFAMGAGILTFATLELL